MLPPMAGKVFFYRYGPAIESLLEEFRRLNSPFVIFEEDLALARNLRDRGYNVVFGKLAEDPSVLLRVKQARAVVTNAGDHANATCALIVRECGFTGPLYALADDPLYRPPMLQIGATEVFTPAHVLGAALASRASRRISPPAEGMHLLGTRVGMVEFRVRAGSPLAGKKLGDLRLREQHGVSVIGQWAGGVFTTTKGPETRVEPGQFSLLSALMPIWKKLNEWPCRSIEPDLSSWPATVQSGARSLKCCMTPGKPAS